MNWYLTNDKNFLNVIWNVDEYSKYLSRYSFFSKNVFAQAILPEAILRTLGRICWTLESQFTTDHLFDDLTWYVMPHKACKMFLLVFSLHPIKVLQNGTVPWGPEELPLILEEVAQAGKVSHVVARTAQDNRRKVQTKEKKSKLFYLLDPGLNTVGNLMYSQQEQQLK